MTVNSDKLFYTNVEVLNNGMVYERYINKDGQEMVQTSMFKPSLFVNTQVETKYKDIYGNYCAKQQMDDIPHAKKWMYEKKQRDSDYLGMDNFALQYITDNYEGNISYDMDLIRSAFYDIEVTTNDGSFPEPEFALYPIDLITLKDSLEDKIYVLDLLKDDSQNIIEVEKWTPEMDIIDQETLDKVEYITFDSEKELLKYFINYIQIKMPSIMLGWNSDKFDIVYIRNRLLRVFGPEHTNLLSPCNEVYERKIYDEMKGSYDVTYTVKGVAMMDFMDIFKSFSFKPMSSYSLDNVSNQELGRGKVDYLGPIHTLRRGNYLPTYEPEYDENDKLSKWLWVKYKITQYHETKKFNGKATTLLRTLIQDRNVDKIIAMFKSMDKHLMDFNTEEEVSVLKEFKDMIYAVYSAVSHSRFVTYGIYDVQNLVDIDDKNNFTQLVYDLAYLAKIPVSRVMSKIGLWDGIVFSYLKERGIVVPKMEVVEVVERIIGAYVKEVVAGARNYVVSFDLTSLNLDMGLLVGNFQLKNFSNCLGTLNA